MNEQVDKGRIGTCQACGVPVPHDEACGDVRLDGRHDYYCPDCYRATLGVLVHWRDADEEGTVVDHVGHRVSVSFPGDDQPFVFDRVEGDQWAEVDHDRSVRISFHESYPYRKEAAPC